MAGLNPGKISKPRMRAKILGFLKNPPGSRMTSLGNYTVQPGKGGVVNVGIVTYCHNATMYQGRTSDLRAFGRCNSWERNTKNSQRPLRSISSRSKGGMRADTERQAKSTVGTLTFHSPSKTEWENRTSKLERRLIFVVELGVQSDLKRSAVSAFL